MNVLTLVNGKKTLVNLPEQSENFSFHIIAPSVEIKVESNQHMIVTSLTIEGFLNLEGCVVML